MSQVLNVQSRSDLGKRTSRRARRGGLVPVVLYGQGKENVNLSAASEEIESTIRHGGKLVDLKGAVTESAFIKSVQWSVYGTQILHVDLTRVTEGQTVETAIVVELKGTAPGVKAGGAIQHSLHEVRIECPIRSLPDRLYVNINSLQLGESITADRIPLPEGAKLLSAGDAVVVQCVTPVEVEEAAPTGEMAEPELIGRKKAEEEEGAEGEE